MHTLKIIGLTICQLARQAWLIPKSIFVGLRDRREESQRDMREAERLDRIRHPGKYVGRS
jgi:hypothetical protein